MQLNCTLSWILSLLDNSKCCLLTGDNEALGKEHPDTATLLKRYAILLRKMNREGEANKLEARARRFERR